MLRPQTLGDPHKRRTYDKEVTGHSKNSPAITQSLQDRYGGRALQSLIGDVHTLPFGSEPGTFHSNLVRSLFSHGCAASCSQLTAARLHVWLSEPSRWLGAWLGMRAFDAAAGRDRAGGLAEQLAGELGSWLGRLLGAIAAGRLGGVAGMVSGRWALARACARNLGREGTAERTQRVALCRLLDGAAGGRGAEALDAECRREARHVLELAGPALLRAMGRAYQQRARAHAERGLADKVAAEWADWSCSACAWAGCLLAQAGALAALAVAAAQRSREALAPWGGLPALVAAVDAVIVYEIEERLRRVCDRVLRADGGRGRARAVKLREAMEQVPARASPPAIRCVIPCATSQPAQMQTVRCFINLLVREFSAQTEVQGVPRNV